MASAAVRALAKVRTPRVTLEQLTGEVADRRRAGAYLHGVLPPLLARMAVSLEDGAPASLAGLPAFDELIAWYGASAAKISEVSPPPEWATWRRKPSATFLEREEKFGAALDEVREAGRAVRAKVFGALADGGWLHRAPAASDEVDAFLSDFYAKRLTLRLLLGQHRACRLASEGESAYLWGTFGGLDADGDGVLEPDELLRARSLYDAQAAELRAHPKPSVCGLVDREMSPFDVSVQAIADVQEEVLRSPRNPEGRLPRFRLFGRGEGATIPFLPRHLYKILRDVLRNAARAAFVKSAATGEPLGEVTVVIADADDNSDVVVKVSDTAGGIPRSKLNRIFSFSAASRNYKEVANDLADQSLCQALGPASLQGGAPDVLSPASDEGHALPLAKVYATLFGGDLKLLSMEGHGTDCYVYISRIEDNVLPT